MKYECLLSPLDVASDCGVMCSATQCGFRVARLNDEVREEPARRSATGPGKPYWKRPFGSTGFVKAGTAGARDGRAGGEAVGVGAWEVDEDGGMVASCLGFEE